MEKLREFFSWFEPKEKDHGDKPLDEGEPRGQAEVIDENDG